MSESAKEGPSLLSVGISDARRRVEAEAQRLESLLECPTVGATAIIDGEQAVKIGNETFLTRSGKKVPHPQWDTFLPDNSLAEEIIYEAWAHAHKPEEAATDLPVYLRTIRVCGGEKMLALVIPAGSTAVDFYGRVWNSYKVENAEVVPDNVEWPGSNWNDPKVIKKCRDGVFTVAYEGKEEGTVSPSPIMQGGWEYRSIGIGSYARTPAELNELGFDLFWLHKGDS